MTPIHASSSLMLLLVLAAMPMASRADFARATMQERAEGESSGFGYERVADALDALVAKEGVITTVNKQGWTEIEDKGQNVLWSFVPEDHPAYPSVVRRTTSGRGESVQIDMDAVCEAEKAACEKLMKEMVRMNEIARNRFIRNPPRGGGAKADVTPIGGLMASGRY